MLGIGLFAQNFVVLFVSNDFTWWQYIIVVIVALIYLFVLGYATFYPTKPIKALTKEEAKDHEYA